MKLGVHAAISSESMDVGVLAQKAEELGFESFWLPEHIIMPVNTNSKYPGSPDGSIPEYMSHYIDPLVGLAGASAVTQSIKLGTGVCKVPERNPLLLAKEIATLDHFSGGRFIFGIGVGWHREETETMGANFERRWSQAREAVLAMKELWTKDEAEYHGKFYDFPPSGRSQNRPKSPIHPSSWGVMRPMSSSVRRRGPTGGCPPGCRLRKWRRAGPPWMSFPLRPDETRAPSKSRSSPCLPNRSI